MPRPEDTRCRGMLSNGSQCENKISYDEDGDNWSVLCSEHREEDNVAREAGEPRVGRFDHKEESAEFEVEAEDEEA